VFPCFGIHPLQGSGKDLHSVKVQVNMRKITKKDSFTLLHMLYYDLLVQRSKISFVLTGPGAIPSFVPEAQR